jgi:site-specific DNA-methyltransferase (adenine-specific)
VEWASDTEAAEVNQRSGPNARYAGVPESSVVGYGQKMPNAKDDKTSPLGRWPANIAHDGSDEVLAVFPQSAGQMADVPIATGPRKSQNAYGTMSNGRAGEPSAEKRYTDDGATNYAMLPGQRRGDAGSAARFFYCAKATTAERNDGLWDFEAKAPGAGSRNLTGDPLVDRIHGLNPKKNSHPTVKPVDLMRWLVRLITPPDGIVLDPFMGSGTTLIAARAEGHKSIGVDLEEAHCEIARGRMSQGVLL